MNPSNESKKDSGDTARPQADQAGVAPRKTPNADMQAEDTGTPESETDSATAAERAMKQTSKTGAGTAQ